MNKPELERLLTVAINNLEGEAKVSEIREDLKQTLLNNIYKNFSVTFVSIVTLGDLDEGYEIVYVGKEKDTAYTIGLKETARHSCYTVRGYVDSILMFEDRKYGTNNWEREFDKEAEALQKLEKAKEELENAQALVDSLESLK